MVELLPSPRPDRIAGVELGGVPLATALSLETGIPMLIVRRQAKEYGTARGIEGVATEGETVVLIEDVLTTAGQAITAAAEADRSRVAGGADHLRYRP